MPCIYASQTATCSNASGWGVGFDTISAAQEDNGYNPSMRHFEGSNFLYIDGHVKFLPFDTYHANRTTILTDGIS